MIHPSLQTEETATEEFGAVIEIKSAKSNILQHSKSTTYRNLQSDIERPTTYTHSRPADVSALYSVAILGVMEI